MSQKYGRTFHLPQSPGLSKEDRRMPHQDLLAAADEVVATEKMGFGRQERFVLRDAAAFLEADMSVRMGKYVRAGHVQSDVH